MYIGSQEIPRLISRRRTSLNKMHALQRQPTSVPLSTILRDLGGKKRNTKHKPRIRMETPLLVIRIGCAGQQYVQAISKAYPVLMKDKDDPKLWTANEPWSDNIDGDLPCDVVESRCKVMYVIVPETPVHELPKPQLAEIEELASTIRYVDQELHDIKVIILVDGIASDDICEYWEDVLLGSAYHSTMANLFLCELASLGSCTWSGKASIQKIPGKFLNGIQVRHRQAPDLPKKCQLIAIGVRPGPTHLLSVKSGYFISVSHHTDTYTTHVLQAMSERKLTFILRFDNDHLFCYWTGMRCQAILLKRPEAGMVRHLDVANYRVHNMGMTGRGSVRAPPEALQLPVLSRDGKVIQQKEAIAKSSAQGLSLGEAVNYVSGKPLPADKQHLVAPIVSVQNTSTLERNAFMRRSAEQARINGSSAPPTIVTPSTSIIDTASFRTALSRQQQAAARTQAARRERYLRLQNQQGLSQQVSDRQSDGKKRSGSTVESRGQSSMHPARKRARQERSIARDVLTISPDAVKGLIEEPISRLSSADRFFDFAENITSDASFSWKKFGESLNNKKVDNCDENAVVALDAPITSVPTTHGVEFVKDEDSRDCEIKKIEASIGSSSLEFGQNREMPVAKIAQVQLHGALLKLSKARPDIQFCEARAKQMHEIICQLEKAGFSPTEWRTFFIVCEILQRRKSHKDSR